MDTPIGGNIHREIHDVNGHPHSQFGIEIQEIWEGTREEVALAAVCYCSARDLISHEVLQSEIVKSVCHLLATYAVKQTRHDYLYSTHLPETRLILAVIGKYCMCEVRARPILAWSHQKPQLIIAKLESNL